MYLVHLKTTLVDAVRQTFDDGFPEADFRDLHASIEFPVKPQNYPGVWVDFATSGAVKKVGIAHVEVETETPEGGMGRTFTRWAFQGHASFTLVALNSQQRDRLHDQFLRVIAFGGPKQTWEASEPTTERIGEDHHANTFRSIIEGGEFIAMNADFDEIDVRGFAQAPGTPWQSEDIIYECEVVLEVWGEFVLDNDTFELAPLSAVRLTHEPYGSADADLVADESFWVLGEDSLGDEIVEPTPEEEEWGPWI